MSISGQIPIPQLRQHLHALAELSGQEAATAAFVAEDLAASRPQQLVTGLGGHGVLAVFSGPDPGPTVLLRAELDALPIPETIDLDHASFTPEVSHKCGHDGHMAILLGVARKLHHQPPVQGRVVLLFQPAEETGAGAAAVLADPRFVQPDPNWIFALHNLPGYPVNTVVVVPGTFCAASAGLDVTLTGKTSHAAHPEQGISPDRAMAQLVLDLINLPDSLQEPDHLALVTVVHSSMGKPAIDVTSGEAKILATLRADQNAVLEELKDSARLQVAAVAGVNKLAWSVVFRDEFPAVVNDRQAVAAVRQVARDLGLSLASPSESPFRWSEDFGHLSARGRGALIGLGAGHDHPGLHAENYDFNDALLPCGISLLTALSRRVLSPAGRS